MTTSEGFYDKDLDAGLTELEIGDDKVGVSYKFEKEVDELINSLAKKGQEYTRKVDGIDKDFECQHQFDEYPDDLPTNKGGVLLYYFLKGVEQDFKVKFKKKPYCVEIKGTSAGRGSNASDPNTFTKAQKNRLYQETQDEYWQEKIDSGELTYDQVDEKIVSARKELRSWREKGWEFTSSKSNIPLMKDSEEYQTQLLADEKRSKRQGETAKINVINRTQKSIDEAIQKNNTAEVDRLKPMLSKQKDDLAEFQKKYSDLLKKKED